MVRYHVDYPWPSSPVCWWVRDRRGAGLLGRLLRIPSFIVTLAGMLVFKGLALALCRASRWGRSRDVPEIVVGLHFRSCFPVWAR